MKTFFIYCLFNDACSRSDYSKVASNDQLIRDKGRDVQIPGARSPLELPCVQWHPILVGPQYETSVVKPLWGL